MGKLALIGSKEKGIKVIEILEMLGGKNVANCYGVFDNRIYFVNDDGYIEDADRMHHLEYTQMTIEDFEKKYPYKVGDMVSYKWHKTFFTDTIVGLTWDEERNDFICSLKENDFKYYMSDLKKYDMSTPKTLVGLFPVTGDRYQMIVDNYYEIINENGKYYVVKKKPQYPKTYEDCREVLGLGIMENYGSGYKRELIIHLQELLICRDAYWKIAGEEMGLDKPWEPSLKKGETHYAISNVGGKITYEMYGEYNAILVFPTKEMREMFHKHFKKGIELCKELL